MASVKSSSRTNDSAARGESPHGRDEAARCAHCNATNPPNNKFCGGCGQLLWEPCLECGHEAATGVVFCGACGANRVELITKWCDQFAGALDRAEELASAGRYRDCLVTLNSVNRQDHPRLKNFMAKARARIEEVKEESDRRRAEALVAWEQAEELVAESRFDRATELLAAQPHELLIEPARAELARLRELQTEANNLEKNIRQAISDRAYKGLLPQVCRLLEIRPHHAEAKKLRTQLEQLEGKSQRTRGDQLRAAARGALAKKDYIKAASLLEEVAPSARDESFEKIYDTAAELASLARHLRESPVADATLLALAGRLAKYQPDDSNVAELLEQARQRAQTVVKDRRLPAPLWSKPGSEPKLGIPCTPLAGLRTLVVDDKDVAARLAESPGRFIVACGIAIEGLDSSAVDINLLPKQRSGMFDRLGLKRSRRAKPPTTAWGIDLTPSGLKAVKLEIVEQPAGDERVGPLELKIIACDFQPHAEVLERLQSAEAREAIQHQTVKAFLQRNDVQGSRVCVGFPGTGTLGRFFPLPPLFSSKINEIVEYEARGRIPLPLDTLCWGAHVFGAAQLSDDEAMLSRRAMLIAAREAQVRDHLAILRQNEVTVDRITSDCVALYNVLFRETLSGRHSDDPDPDDTTAAVAVVDIGAEVINVVVASPHVAWFRTLNWGSFRLIRQLTRELKLTHEQAEELLRKPQQASRLYRFENALAPLYDELVNEIERSLAMFQKEYPGYQVAHIHGAGGAFLLHGLWKRLR